MEPELFQTLDAKGREGKRRAAPSKTVH